MLRKPGPVAAAGARLGFGSQSQVTERRGQRLGGELRLLRSERERDIETASGEIETRGTFLDLWKTQNGW